jgi:hypothetical protein
MGVRLIPQMSKFKPGLFIHDSSHLPAAIAHALPFQAWNRLVTVPLNADGSAYRATF